MLRARPPLMFLREVLVEFGWRLKTCAEIWTWTRAHLIQRGSGYWSIFKLEEETFPCLRQTGEGSSPNWTRAHAAPILGLAMGVQLNLTCNSHLSESDRCEFK